MHLRQIEASIGESGTRNNIIVGHEIKKLIGECE